MTGDEKGGLLNELMMGSVLYYTNTLGWIFRAS
jgi:hypothetical protein